MPPIIDRAEDLDVDKFGSILQQIRTDDKVSVASILGWAFFIVLVVVINFVTDFVTREPIESWARSSGFKILARKTNWLKWTPFSFNRSTAQVVYRLELEDSAGHRQSAYVKCGSPVLGALFNPKELVVQFVKN